MGLPQNDTGEVGGYYESERTERVARYVGGKVRRLRSEAGSWKTNERGDLKPGLKSTVRLTMGTDLSRVMDRKVGVSTINVECIGGRAREPGRQL